MLSTAIKRVIAACGIALFSIGSSIAAPSSPDKQIAVVGGLYKAFAWQAISGANEIFGKPLPEQEKSVLLRYFDPELASLLIADRRCAQKTGDVCNLGFDPIFVSQDPGAADLSIRSVGNGIVAVEFTYPSNREKIQLEYHLVKRDGQWRINDIRYEGWKNASLKQLLANKLTHQGK
ncbi:DUF3828 domain-containing protein [Massilia niastensis]|uniref:DUF3828 domain-containing protein n=1 Tax=Massilia niastensis TaxID=544911 RepID=UPI00037CBA96|nr:DUF3828 domain-containing protein [Massilia niastensis]